MDDLIDGLIAFFQLLWTVVSALLTLVWAILGFVWRLLEAYPALRLIVAVAAIVAFVYWFADGVKNWRRKCWRCRGKGAFDSKISANRNRPCDCCANDDGGAGRHPTLRYRIWNRTKR